MNPSQTQVLEQLVRETTEALAAGKRRFVVHLEPIALGQVTLEIAFEQAAYVLKIAAQRQSTEQLIESDLGRLREAFETVLAQLSSDSDPTDLPPAS